MVRMMTRPRWIPWVACIALACASACGSAGRHNHSNPSLTSAAPQLYKESAATWKQVAVGESTVLGAKNDGSLWVWGWNRRGGNDAHLDLTLHIEHNQPPVALPPTRIGKANDWASVTAADGGMFAVKSDGTLWSWPEDLDHEDPARPQAEQVPSDSVLFREPSRVGSESDWRQVAATRFHTMALKSDGTLLGWGDNSDGALGDGPRERRTEVRMTNDRWLFVATTWRHTVAVRADHTLWMWGKNVWGKQTKYDEVSPPTQLGRDNDWQQVSLSGSHLLAIKSNGTLWACGDNRGGQLGLGFSESGETHFLPAQIGHDNDWVLATSGDEFSLAIKRDGSLWSWGENHFGQLGDGTTEGHSAPARIAGNTTWRSAYAGHDHVVAESSDGTTWTWGSNRNGQLGDGRVLATRTPSPVQPGSKWRFASAESGSTLGLRDDNTLWLWSGEEWSFPAPKVEWKVLDHFRGTTVFGIRADGSLWEISWPKGELQRITSQPFGEDQSHLRWARLSVTAHGVLVLDEEDSLWTLGKVSVNNQREIWEPRRVGEPKVWSSAFAEIQPTVVMAQKKDGTLWLADTAWGHKAPVQIDKKLNWQALMVGEAEILALGKDGRLWRIDGGDKQRIGLHSEWKEASTARHHSVAIRKDGTLWSWGQGEAGELGTIYSGASDGALYFPRSGKTPATVELPLSLAMGGLGEAIATMRSSELRRFWIPAKLAHATPTADAKNLVFDIRLVSIAREEEPYLFPDEMDELEKANRAPRELASPPRSAQTTPSGLKYRVLETKKGRRAESGNEETTSFTFKAWTKDGKLLDHGTVGQGYRGSGSPQGSPALLLIDGMAEAVRLMRPGKQYRFWIPAALAYGDDPHLPNVPAGMILVDLEMARR